MKRYSLLDHIKKFLGKSVKIHFKAFSFPKVGFDIVHSPSDHKPVYGKMLIEVNDYFPKRIMNYFHRYKKDEKSEQGYLILSISEEVDQILFENGAEEKYDIAVEKLKADKHAYELVFGNETLIDFLYSGKIR